MDDKQIIRLFFERSEQAIAELSGKYGDLCFKIADNILNDPQDAEECVNDAYLGAWNSIPPQAPDPLRAYICRIVRNLALKKHRANSAAKRGSRFEVSLSELEDCLPDNSFEEHLSAGELAAYHVHQAILVLRAVRRDRGHVRHHPAQCVGAAQPDPQETAPIPEM